MPSAAFELQVFLDLDGTILDASQRYWRVHKDVLVELGKSYLPRDEYWYLKRIQTPIPDILAHVGAESVTNEYIQKRFARIETPGYLVYDRICAGAREALLVLKQEHHLVLVTLRRSVKTLHGELQSLELLPLFVQVLSSGEQLKPRWKVKVNLVRSNGYGVGTPGIMVGDTENDILAGQHLGLWTVGIFNGIRTRKRLEAVNPDVLLPSIVELVPLLGG